MRCPTCNSDTRVVSTRDAEAYRATWLKQIAAQYPSAIFRRRACQSCSWRSYTVELPMTQPPAEPSVEEHVSENVDQCDSVAMEA